MPNIKFVHTDNPLCHTDNPLCLSPDLIYPITLDKPNIVQKQRELLMEAWSIIYTLEGEAAEPWGRAQEWLGKNFAYKPEGIVGAEWLKERYDNERIT